MATWADIEREAPELAERVHRAFAAGTNKTIATLRKDGAPRISALETEFKDGQVTFGMMGSSLKLLDVRRDPRVALHSPTLEPGTDRLGDAKIAGRVVEVAAPEDDARPGAGYFTLDIGEVAHTGLGDPADHLVITTWHPDRGARRVQRRE